MAVRELQIILVIASSLALAALMGCGGGQPAIDLPQTDYDFGAIVQGETATIQLPVRNAGQADLHIESVSTSCGCTSARVEPMTIPPGGEATLTIQYDSGVHPDEGAIWRIVYLASDDPERPESQVEIRGEVRRD